MFAYCANNPVNRIDNYGNSWKDVKNWFSNTWSKIKNWAKSTFGAGATVEKHELIKEKEYAKDLTRLVISVKAGIKRINTISKKGNSSKPVSVYAKGRIDDPLLSSVGIKLNIEKFAFNVSLGMDDIGLSGSITNGNAINSFGVKADITQLKVGFEYSTTAVLDDSNMEMNYTNVSVTAIFLIAVYYLVTTGDTSYFANQHPASAYGY